MRIGSAGTWPSVLSTGLLILAAPLMLGMGWVVLVSWPREVIGGVAQLFSAHDVVQLADGKETGVTLFLALLLVWGACWLLRLRLPPGAAFWAGTLGVLLCIPIMAVLGLGAEYGLEAALAARGYRYCTFHVTALGKGSEGTYVYVRNGLPGGCDAVRTVFPPGKPVPDRRDAFDLPPG